MIIDHSKEKLYNAMTYFIKNTNHCYKTKLFKLLYYLDMLHFQQTGRSVTGLNYYAWPLGPYPCELADKIDTQANELHDNFIIEETNENVKKYEITPLKEFNDTHFTKRELRLMEKIAFSCKNIIGRDMVELTHMSGDPWDITMKTKGEKELIDYFLAVNEKLALSKEEIKERINEKEELAEIFIHG